MVMRKVIHVQALVFSVAVHLILANLEAAHSNVTLVVKLVHVVLEIALLRQTSIAHLGLVAHYKLIVVINAVSVAVDLAGSPLVVWFALHRVVVFKTIHGSILYLKIFVLLIHNNLNCQK